MTRLYDRTAELQLIRPAATGFFSFLPNATVIKDLRVAFKIEKTLRRDPNSATISVYNLARGSRQEATRRPLHVRLFTGYGDDRQQLFAGDLYYSHSRREGATWHTSFECGDGTRAYRFARISQSFKANTSSINIIKTLAGSMGLTVPRSKESAAELLKQYSTGFTVQGPSFEAMTKVLRRHDMTWSIQDGELQILRVGEPRPGEALLVSEQTGMIGSPEFGAPTKKGRQPILKVKLKLNGAFRPGHRIKVVSRDVSGVFRTVKVSHMGDTRGQTWTTMLEAVA